MKFAFRLGVLLLGLFFFTAQSAEAQARRFALVVGVREYPNSDKLTRLEFTESDADQMAVTLGKVGFDVTLMTQKASQGDGRQRYNPTANFIRRQFADLVATPFLKPEDCILVTLAGHGIQLPSKEDPKLLTFFFCPADADIEGLTHAEDVEARHSLIPVQELYETLDKSKAGVKLLVLDACRNDPNKPSAFRSPNSVTRPVAPEPPGGMIAFFSCSENEQAVEDADLRHGVFTHYLIEGLSGKADLNGDKQISTNELYEHVTLQVFTFVRQKYNRRQTPEMVGKLRGFAPLCQLAANTVPMDNTKPPMTNPPLANNNTKPPLMSDNPKRPLTPGGDNPSLTQPGRSKTPVKLLLKEVRGNLEYSLNGPQLLKKENNLEVWSQNLSYRKIDPKGLLVTSDGQMVYVIGPYANGGSQVRAFQATDGSELWSVPLREEAGSAVHLQMTGDQQGLIVVGKSSSGYEIRVLKRQDGAERGKSSRETTQTLTAITAPPTAEGEVIMHFTDATPMESSGKTPVRIVSTLTRKTSEYGIEGTNVWRKDTGKLVWNTNLAAYELTPLGLFLTPDTKTLLIAVKWILEGEEKLGVAWLEANSGLLAHAMIEKTIPVRHMQTTGDLQHVVVLYKSPSGYEVELLDFKTSRMVSTKPLTTPKTVTDLTIPEKATSPVILHFSDGTQQSLQL